MKFLALSNSKKVAKIDDWNFDRVNNWNWCIRDDGHVHAWVFGRSVLLSRYVKKVVDNPNVHIDHDDHDLLNNLESNLRCCDRSENLCNQKLRVDSTSGLKGVSWEKRRNHWRAYITKNGVTHYLGSFSTKEEAAKAYNEAAKKLHGEFALLNKV